MLEDEESSKFSSEDELEDDASFDPCGGRDDASSVEGSVSTKSVNVQPNRSTGLETNNVERLNNNLEADMIIHIVEGNQRPSINRGMEGLNESNDWVAVTLQQHGSTNNANQPIVCSVSNSIGSTGCLDAYKDANDSLGPAKNVISLAHYEDQAQPGFAECELGVAHCAHQIVAQEVNGVPYSNVRLLGDMWGLGNIKPLMISLLGQKGIEINILSGANISLALDPDSVMVVPHVLKCIPVVVPGGDSHSPSPNGDRTSIPEDRSGQSRATSSGVRLRKQRRRGRPQKCATSGRKAIDAIDSDILRCNDAFWKTYNCE